MIALVDERDCSEHASCRIRESSLNNLARVSRVRETRDVSPSAIIGEEFDAQV